MVKKWWKKPSKQPFFNSVTPIWLWPLFFSVFQPGRTIQLIVGGFKKIKNQKFKKFQKIDQIFKRNFLNLCHGSKKASKTLLNGSGVLFWLNFWVPDIIWTVIKTIHKIRKFLASRGLKTFYFLKLSPIFVGPTLCQFSKYSNVLSSERLKPLFWFRSDTETKI